MRSGIGFSAPPKRFASKCIPPGVEASPWAALVAAVLVLVLAVRCSRTIAVVADPASIVAVVD